MEKEAVEKVYQAHLNELHAYLYRLSCDQETAKDIAQDTYLKAAQNILSFKGNSSLKTWLFAIATNLAKDWLRKEKRWSVDAQDKAKALAESDAKYREEFVNIHQSSPQGQFNVKEHINFCFTCISKTLPIEQQIAILLKDVLGFKVQEIGTILDTPQGTVKHWLFTGRKTMSEVFDKRCALINQKGVCHQCSELNGLFNPKQTDQIEKLGFKKINSKDELYQLRTALIQQVDPINSEGAVLEDAIMQVLKKAIKQ